MNQFTKLPREIIEYIFAKVYPIDLLNLRMVDKCFKEICDLIKIKQLSVTDQIDYPSFSFYINDPTYFTHKNQLECSKLPIYKSI